MPTAPNLPDAFSSTRFADAAGTPKPSVASPWAPIPSSSPSLLSVDRRVGKTTGHGFIHGFLVRKAEKQHGMAQRIEGFREKGAKVVIVDDVCTTGASTIQAIEAAKEFGFDIVAIACLVERQEAHGRSSVEKAAGSVPFVTIFTAQDVREEHLRLKAAGLLKDEHNVFAVSVKCDYCDRIAVTIQGGYRCDIHRTEGHE